MDGLWRGKNEVGEGVRLCGVVCEALWMTAVYKVSICDSNTFEQDDRDSWWTLLYMTSVTLRTDGCYWLQRQWWERVWLSSRSYSRCR